MKNVKVLADQDNNKSFLCGLDINNLKLKQKILFILLEINSQMDTGYHLLLNL